MTRQEAIAYGKRVIDLGLNDETQAFCELSVKALEQEPYDDAISREDALMALTGEWTEITDEIIHRFIKRIKALPSVNPQQKTGHWKIKRASIHPYGNDVACSECGFTMGSSFGYRYCPSCGARMESEEQT